MRLPLFFGRRRLSGCGPGWPAGRLRLASCGVCGGGRIDARPAVDYKRGCATFCGALAGRLVWRGCRLMRCGGSFACLATEAGAPSRLLQVAGRWSDIRMVERYTGALAGPGLFARYSPVDFAENGSVKPCV